MTPMIYSSICNPCEAKSSVSTSIPAPQNLAGPAPVSKGIIFPSTPAGICPVNTGNTSSRQWDLSTALDACEEIENVMSVYGFHVALSGGTLYKSGIRKDVDIWIYPHTVDRSNRFLNKIEVEWAVSKVASIFKTTWSRGYQKCYTDDKVVYKLDNNIDLFFPYTDF